MIYSLVQETIQKEWGQSSHQKKIFGVRWGKMMESPEREAILECFEDLGGNSSQKIQLAPVTYDFQVGNLLIIVDDATHFNQYRSMSLLSDLYEHLPHFPLDKYRMWSRKYRSECLKSATAGELWENKSSEKHFGLSDERPHLIKHGASAWKLRAFKDFLQDIGPLFGLPKCLRISIYDELVWQGQIKSVKDSLLQYDPKAKEHVQQYIARKIQQHL